MRRVHAGHRYFAKDILWGARLADVLSETTDGHLLLDLPSFHDVEPTAPMPDFSYPTPTPP
jgi:inward rectifier potassium channel